ncbi:MAG TPA: OB-fold nucleic acid binding domain-containing protein, partial [Sphingomicrobium sp.]|nr:OB-fold nucleic acid binding domain-containing protein [Sphingomicrobium sp.]
AREHGVEVRAVDVNESEWDCTLEAVDIPASVRAELVEALPFSSQGKGSPPTSSGRTVLALRLGLRQVEGLHREAADRLVEARRRSPFTDVEDVRRRGVPAPAIERLAAADAFRSIALDRRGALWDAKGLKSGPGLPLFAAADARDEGSEADPVALPAMGLSEHVVTDYQTTRLSLKAHPMHFLREHYAARGFITANQLGRIRDGRRLSIAGLVLIRQRPGSAKGVCFITLEDETGVANLVIWPDVFTRQRKIVMGARLMAVQGIIQKDEADGIIHVVARQLIDDTAMLRKLSDDIMPSTLNQGDGAGSWRPPAARHPRDVEIIPKSRDFH